MYEGKGDTLVSALNSLSESIGANSLPKVEEMRYRVDLVSADQKTRYSSGAQETYELALDAAREKVTDVTQRPHYTTEVFVTGKYDVQRKPDTPRASGAAPSERRTRDITGLF